MSTQVEGEKPIKPKRKVLPTPPGLTDALAHLKDSLGAAQIQMVQGQVIGILRSFISNRQNDFVDAVFGSTIKDPLRRHLFTIKKAGAWFDLARSVKVEGKEVPLAARRLARNIMTQVLARHRKPSMRRIGMVVDQRIAKLSDSRNAKNHDLWLRMTVKAGGPLRQIEIPVRSNGYFAARKGERKKTFQIIEDRETGRISVGVITDVGETFALSRAKYAEGVKSLDFGLSTMFASSEGDLMGRNFLAKLKTIDRTISGIARHVRRNGGKPRQSRRYVAHVARLRGYITTELRRVMNRYVELRKPTMILLERLDFRRTSPASGAEEFCMRTSTRRGMSDRNVSGRLDIRGEASVATPSTCWSPGMSSGTTGSGALRTTRGRPIRTSRIGRPRRGHRLKRLSPPKHEAESGDGRPQPLTKMWKQWIYFLRPPHFWHHGEIPQASDEAFGMVSGFLPHATASFRL